METFKLIINKEKFTCSVANNAEDRKVGYSGDRKSPKDTECMLFVFPSVGKNQMWMKDTKFPLDIVFLDKDCKVLESICAEENSNELLGSSEDVAYVLEFPEGMCDDLELKKGDEIEDIPEEFLEAEDNPVKMQVLDDKGNAQMDIQGGERIFSRKATKKIIDQAIACKSDDDKKTLAKTLLKEIIAQDDRGSDYVKGKTKESYKLNNK